MGCHRIHHLELKDALTRSLSASPLLQDKHEDTRLTVQQPRIQHAVQVRTPDKTYGEEIL